jgi:hydrogenase maturation factor
MIGEVRKDRLVTTGGARAEDLLLLVKGICIEGTSILARERKDELLAKGIPPSLIEKARNFIFDPGIDILRPALAACDAVSVHSMHDPTEGGLVNGIVEMALASEKEIQVDLEKVHIYEESQILCKEYGLNPHGVIASGALLLSISSKDLPLLQRAFQKAAIPIQVIGKVKQGPSRVLTVEGKEIKPLSRDEILKIYES